MGLILLSNSKIQTFVGQLAMVELSDRVGAEIRVGKIEYTFFNRLEVSGLDIYDQKGDTLFTLGDTRVNFDFFKIFQGEFLIHRVQIDDLNFHFRQDSTGQNNMQFLLDLMPEGNKQPFEGLVNAPDIELRNSNFVFAQQDSTGQWKEYKFQHIQGNLCLQHFSRDSLDAEIKDFQLLLLGQTQLEKLTLHLQANRQQANLGNLKLKLAHSQAAFDTLHVRYDSIGGLKHPEHWTCQIKSKELNVGLQDLAPLLPQLKNNPNTLSAQLNFTGKLADMYAHRVTLNYNQQQLFCGTMHVQGLPNLNKTWVNADITRAAISKATLQDLIADFSRKPFVMPKTISGLSTMAYQGHISGRLHDLRLRGLLTTNLGSVQTNASLQMDSAMEHFHFNGTVATQHFRLGQLIGQKDLGALSFRVNTDMMVNRQGHVAGTVKGQLDELQYRGYTYHSITADGRFTDKSFDGRLTANSRELNLRFLGRADLSKKVPEFRFGLQLNHLRLYDLHLINRYPMFDLAGHVKVNLSCSSLDNLNGILKADSVAISTENGSYTLQNLLLNSTANQRETKLLLTSDILEAQASGHYTNSTLLHTFARLVQQAMPNLIPPKLAQKLAHEKRHNEMEFSASVHNIDELCHVLNVPLQMPEPLELNGQLSEQQQMLNTQIGIPQLTIGETTHLRNIDIQWGAQDQQLYFQTAVQTGQEEKPVNLSFGMTATQDSAHTLLSWLGADTTEYRGSLRSDIYAQQINGQPSVGITLQPSCVIIADSTWNLRKSYVTLNADTTIEIDGFRFEGRDQTLTIDGKASSLQSDSIRVGLQNIDLGYWLSFVPLDGIWFGGRTTGDVTAYGVFGRPAFNANITVINAQINDNPMGDVMAHASWNPMQQEVRMEGTAIDGGREVAQVRGNIATNKDSLDFYFLCDSLNLGFINAYTDPISLNIQGRAFGHLHLYKYPKIGAIRLVGAACAKHASIGVGMLGTRYYLQDSVRLTEKAIRFDSIAITDAEGHKGMVNGYLSHNGAFQNFKYHIAISTHNLLAMNTSAQDNDLYYGHVYATGKVRIDGNEQEVDINVDAHSDPNSVFNINAASRQNAQESNFVRFVSKSDSTKLQIAKNTKTKISSADEPGALLHLSLSVNVTPDATLKCITDPKTGDMLTTRGNGDLHITYDAGSDVRLLGNYTLESGSYSFTLQDVIHRNFKIDRGSTINWSGNPLNGDVNITAKYNTTASLSDLDATIAAQTSRKTVPVSCILQLTGKLLHPEIGFSIDLPQTEEGIKQQVLNLINTEELRNREVIYLLILNKFYKPDYMASTTNNISQNDAYSLLTSTVTGQINNWISKLSNKFTVGLNIRTNEDNSGQYSQEYAGEFMYQPNPRLVINGNLGYRNDATSSNKLIADADIEYMLTRNGRLRAKAYTHTVDKYEDVTKDGRTKQGIGFIYRRDFNYAKELFQRPPAKRDAPKKSSSKKTSK